MASEVPVVGCNAGGIPHTIRPVENTGSFLVETGDIDGYVEKLTRLQNNPEMRKEMGKRAREEMLKWKWEDSMADLKDQTYQAAKENKHKRWENRIWRAVTVQGLRRRIGMRWKQRQNRQNTAIAGGGQAPSRIVAAKVD